MKPGDYIIEAARKQAEGEIAVHLANIKVYQTMPAGIGEHSDILGAIQTELDKICTNEERIDIINKHFKT